MTRLAGNRGDRGDHGGTGLPLATLATAVLLLGIADSMVGAYVVLFATDDVGLSPVRASLFSAAPAAGGMVLTSLAGRRFDARPTKAYATSGALVGALGFVLLTTTTSFAVLLLIALTVLAALQAVFPQLFSLARVVLGESAVGQRAAPLLRSGWSLAWALGPLLGTVLLSTVGFTGVLLSAAVVLVLAALATAAVSSPRPRSVPRVAEPEHELEHGPDGEGADLGGGPRPLGLLILSVVLFFLAMFAGSVALPLYVTRQLGLPTSTVGLLYSACAAVEVLAALALAVVPVQSPQRALIAAGMVALAAYFAITLTAQRIPMLVVGQAARGIAIAVVGAAGIRYFQDLMPSAAGRATALFSNASTAGALVAGVLAGVAVQYAGYTSALVLCGVTALAAAAAFAAATSPRLAHSHPPHIDDASSRTAR